MAEPLPIYAVSICGVDDDGLSRILTTDADGNLVLAANVDLDTTGLASSANQTSELTKLDTLHSDLAAIAALVDGLEGFTDGIEAAIASTNTKLDTLHTDLGTTLAGYLDGLEGYLDTVEAKLTALADPTTYTAVTPSDSTDVTATTTKGLFVSVTGNVNVTGVGGSAVSLGTQIAGTTIPGALSRVNAATTATVFGLSGP